jgi:hypothetical protein
MAYSTPAGLWWPGAVVWALLVVSCAAHGADLSEGSDAGSPRLDTITVVATGVSNMTAASAGDVSQAQLQSEPLLRPAAILENIPGLIVTQHSGEGKANQYFLRAFNLDHGTDLALEVDDMPVNMPSHTHGQGYSDFNFVIPELAGDLHYKKGPYYADEGDFATAWTARLGLDSEVASAATLGDDDILAANVHTCLFYFGDGCLPRPTNGLSGDERVGGAGQLACGPTLWLN